MQNKPRVAVATGVAIGFILGFFAARIQQEATVSESAPQAQENSSALPSDHPPPKVLEQLAQTPGACHGSSRRQGSANPPGQFVLRHEALRRGRFLVCGGPGIGSRQRERPNRPGNGPALPGSGGIGHRVLSEVPFPGLESRPDAGKPGHHPLRLPANSKRRSGSGRNSWRPTRSILTGSRSRNISTTLADT